MGHTARKRGNDDGVNIEYGRAGCLKYGSHLITRGSISVVRVFDYTAKFLACGNISPAPKVV